MFYIENVAVVSCRASTSRLKKLSHSQGNGLALRLSRLLPLSLSTLAEQLVNVPMVWQQFAYDQTGRHVTRDDLLLVLADVTSLVVRVYLNTSATGTIR